MKLKGRTLNIECAGERIASYGGRRGKENPKKSNCPDYRTPERNIRKINDNIFKSTSGKNLGRGFPRPYCFSQPYLF